MEWLEEPRIVSNRCLGPNPKQGDLPAPLGSTWKSCFHGSGSSNLPLGPPQGCSQHPKYKGGNLVDKVVKWPISLSCGYNLHTMDWSNQTVGPKRTAYEHSRIHGCCFPWMSWTTVARCSKWVPSGTFRNHVTPTFCSIHGYSNDWRHLASHMTTVVLGCWMLLGTADQLSFWRQCCTALVAVPSSSAARVDPRAFRGLRLGKRAVEKTVQWPSTIFHLKSNKQFTTPSPSFHPKTCWLGPSSPILKFVMGLCLWVGQVLPRAVYDQVWPLWLTKLSPNHWWTYKKQWKITIFNGKFHYKWPFSIAMLVHQRVTTVLPQNPPDARDVRTSSCWC